MTPLLHTPGPHRKISLEPFLRVGAFAYPGPREALGRCSEVRPHTPPWTLTPIASSPPFRPCVFPSCL